MWDIGLTPSVITSNWQPPACIRVPFPSVAAYLTSFYDGRKTFETSESINYGDNPANDLGTISIKSLTSTVKSFTASIYMRPVNIEACCPRPIISTKTSIREVHGLVNGFYENFVLDNPFAVMDDLCKEIDDFAFKCFFPIVSSVTVSSGVFVKKNMLVMPLHCYGGNLYLLERDGSRVELKVLEEYIKHDSDLVYLTVNYNCMDLKPIGLGMPSSKGHVLYISPLIGKHSQSYFEVKHHEKIMTTKLIHNIIEVNCKSQPGYCGSILISKGKIYGVQVAGTNEVSSFSNLTQVKSGNVARRECGGR